jgi:hypothetical protein
MSITELLMLVVLEQINSMDGELKFISVDFSVNALHREE